MNPYETIRSLLDNATETPSFPTTLPVNAMGEYDGPLPLIIFTVTASQPYPHLTAVPATRRYSVTLDIWANSFSQLEAVFADLEPLDGHHSDTVQSLWLDDWSDLTEDPGYHRVCSFVLVG